MTDHGLLEQLAFWWQPLDRREQQYRLSVAILYRAQILHELYSRLWVQEDRE